MPTRSRTGSPGRPRAAVSGAAPTAPPTAPLAAAPDRTTWVCAVTTLALEATPTPADATDPDARPRYRIKRQRTPLLCSSPARAHQQLRENHGDMYEDGYYPYALVEPYALDCVYGYGDPADRRWYHWNDEVGGYTPCPEPPGFAQLIAIGIG